MAKKFITLDSGEKLRVKLVQDSDGVQVVVFDEYGDNFDYANHILKISEKGVIRYGGVSSDTGLALDENGYIKQEKC